MKITTRVGRTAAALLATSLLLTACGADDETTTDPAPVEETTPDDAMTDDAMADDDMGTFPVTVEADNGPVALEAKPTMIVSLSPTSTEILFAIGAGDQVVAVDDFSNFPAEAPVTDLSGFQPNVEAILGFEPDLVVLSFDPGDVVAALEAAGVPAIVHGSAVSLDDTYRQIEQLGAATGHVGGSVELVLAMQTDLDAIIAELPADAAGLTYYHELDNTYFSATSSTFIGQLYALMGLENIADAADPDGASFGFPQLSAEYIVEANPDLIFLADTKCCEATTESVAARDGWDQITAVQQDGVIELDDDVASRWGPRLTEYLRSIADAIEQVLAARANA